MFTTNGLRMVGSDKMDKKCKAEGCVQGQIGKNSKIFCLTCHGKGKVKENRLYTLCGVFDHDLTPNQAKLEEMYVNPCVFESEATKRAKWLRLISTCSVRSQEALSEPFSAPSNAIMHIPRSARRKEREAGKVLCVAVGWEEVRVDVGN